MSNSSETALKSRQHDRYLLVRDNEVWEFSVGDNFAIVRTDFEAVVEHVVATGGHAYIWTELVFRDTRRGILAEPVAVVMPYALATEPEKSRL